jgi:transcriptional regulator with XRE-family HTH domain
MAVQEFRLRHNLAAVLRTRGMTAAELSRQTGVAKQVLSDWMAGVQPRKLEQLYVVAQTLGVSMDGLCFAKSEGDLMSDGKSSGSAGSSGVYSDSGEGDLQYPDEIQGRFEVYMRRILDP